MSLPSGSAGLKLHRDIALHLLSECDQLVFIAGAVSTSFPRIHTSLVHYNKNYKYLSKVKLQHIFLVVSTFFGNRILLWLFSQILKVICPWSKYRFDSGRQFHWKNNMKGTIGQFTKLKKNYGPWDFDLVNNSIILIVALEKDWRQLWFIIIIYWKLIISKIKGKVLNWKIIRSKPFYHHKYIPNTKKECCNQDSNLGYHGHNVRY